MRILAIETSCDETGVSVLETNETKNGTTEISVTTNELASQVEDHEEFGGVFPTLAKRLHAQNFPALFARLRADTDTHPHEPSDADKKQIREWLKRHDGLADNLFDQCRDGLPNFDYVAVTVGPGLSPALWVGVNIARSIALIADVPVVPVNHMAGHFVSACAPDAKNKNFELAKPDLPAVALLVSGGHTELIKQDKTGNLEKIGQTRDDAAGEAFDKIGRLLGLPYPAGPEVSQLADEFRNSSIENPFSLPRPMIDADNLDFSFAGLKTAARKQIERAEPMSDEETMAFAYELETAIVDVLITKTRKAKELVKAQSLLAGGGVVANPHLRKRLQQTAEDTNCQLYLSPLALATDNAVMIGLAAIQEIQSRPGNFVAPDNLESITVDDRLSL